MAYRVEGMGTGDTPQQFAFELERTNGGTRITKIFAMVGFWSKITMLMFPFAYYLMNSRHLTRIKSQLENPLSG